MTLLYFRHDTDETAPEYVVITDDPPGEFPDYARPGYALAFASKVLQPPDFAKFPTMNQEFEIVPF